MGFEEPHNCFGIEGGQDTVARSSAAESSQVNPSHLNNYALETPSIAEPAVPTLAPCSGESQASGADRHQPSVAGNVCDCIVCAGVGKKAHISSPFMRPCRVPGCNVPGHDRIWCTKLLQEEASHFHSPGEDKLKCAENDCPVTVSSITDLKRHYTSKHCTKSEKFSCPLVWCKYSGDNGFKRKDKFKSHYRNAHEGKMGPGKASRVTKPKSSEPGSGGKGTSVPDKRSTPPVSRT